MVRKADVYQLLTVANARLQARPATEADVEDGSTPQPGRGPLPLALSPTARAAGLVFLYRGPKTAYLNRPLHDYLQRFVYESYAFAGGGR
jgi:hypothetical protein